MTRGVASEPVGETSRPAHLRRPELAPLWDELARRFGDGRPPAAVVLRDLSLAQQQALADVLGADHLPGARPRIRVDRLVTALGLEGADGLRSLVERLRGPLPDRQTERAAARRARAELWEWLASEMGSLPLAAQRPEGLGTWTSAVRAGGVPAGDVTAHRERLSRAIAVLRRLPADGPSLASLANDVLGDPHALDRGRRLSSLVLDAVACAAGQPRPGDAEAVRLLWEAAGVAPDPLSSTVLTLGLRPPGPGPLSAWARAATDLAEPVVFTLGQLRRWPVAPLPADGVAVVVENPSLVAEAAAQQWTGPPLVCSSGRPTVAVVTLLRQLGGAGAALVQHADFDGPGIGITAWLADRAGTTPWQMGTSEYRAYADGSTVVLAGRVPPTPWDPELSEAMTAAGVAVFEEQVRAELLLAAAQLGR